jgi:ubiquitin C-terminal hydrolase
MRLDATSSLAKPNNTPEAIYSDYLRKHRSMIDKLFVGQMLTTVHCVSCDYKSKTFIPFLEVVLSISGYKNI